MVTSPFFALLSGQNYKLAASEIKGIIEGEEQLFEQKELLDQCLIFNSTRKAVNKVLSRAAFTKRIYKFYFKSKADEEEIKERVKGIHLDLKEERSFRVRLTRVKGSSRHLKRHMLEGEIGRIILKENPGLKVDLENPDVELHGVLTEDYLVFGEKVGEIKRSRLLHERGASMPFTRSGMMNAALARCMVNLACVKRGDVVLDPFCGPGGILTEIIRVGCKAVGIDIDPEMVEMAKVNLSFMGFKNFYVKQGDARKLRRFLDGKVNAIVTDPPYSISTSSFGESTTHVIKCFMPEAYSLLKEKGYMCISHPEGIDMTEIAEKEGFMFLESFKMRMHRSLIRQINILKKP